MAVAAETSYISVDAIPEVAEERQRLRSEALEIIAGRQALQEAGRHDEVPPVIDALSTAENVLRVRDTYGTDSPEYAESIAGLNGDCLRLVSEWYRKKRPEYFPPIRHTYDEVTQDFYSHGLAIGQMTENALRPITDNAEEEGRRINEHVEHRTPRLIRGLGNVAVGGKIRTISECTDKAITEYIEDQNSGAAHRGYGGYVPEIEKVMLRDMSTDEKTNDRIQEQVGVPGIFINHYVILEALHRRDVNAHGMNKTELHSTQLLVTDDLMEFVALLDEVGGEEWCTNLFMGEEVPEGFIKDYAGFRAEAIKRQEGLVDLAKSVSLFILDLAEEKFDTEKAPSHIENFVKALLLEEARKDLTIADQMFDKRTEVGLREVVELQAQGRYEEAALRMREVEQQAPGGGYCSGGSCGLERVLDSTKEAEDLKKKLNAKDGDTIVKDKERACKDCGKKSVVYAYSATKVNKYCTHCEAYESKETRGGK